MAILYSKFELIIHASELLHGQMPTCTRGKLKCQGCNNFDSHLRNFPYNNNYVFGSHAFAMFCAHMHNAMHYLASLETLQSLQILPSLSYIELVLWMMSAPGSAEFETTHRAGLLLL